MAGVKSLHQINKLEKNGYQKNFAKKWIFQDFINFNARAFQARETQVGNFRGVDGTRTHANDAGHARGRTTISKEKWINWERLFWACVIQLL